MVYGRFISELSIRNQSRWAGSQEQRISGKLALFICLLKQKFLELIEEYVENRVKTLNLPLQKSGKD